MAAAVGIERLLRAVELNCSCCLQYFTDPVRLRGCGHSFCRGCISRYCRGRQRAGCPLCREGFELRDLQPNRELAALLSLLPQWVKEEELETQDEPSPSGAAACKERNSAGRRPREKVRPAAARGSSPPTPPHSPGLLPVVTPLYRPNEPPGRPGAPPASPPPTPGQLWPQF